MYFSVRSIPFINATIQTNYNTIQEINNSLSCHFLNVYARLAAASAQNILRRISMVQKELHTAFLRTALTTPEPLPLLSGHLFSS